MKTTDKAAFKEACNSLSTATGVHHNLRDVPQAARREVWAGVLRRYFSGLKSFPLDEVLDAADTLGQRQDRFPTLAQWRDEITAARRRAAPSMLGAGIEPPVDERERIRRARDVFCDRMVAMFPRLKPTADSMRSMPIRVPVAEGDAQ